jgi:hypothetical protein
MPVATVTMPGSETAALLRRYSKMYADRSTFDELWQEVVEYICPWRQNIVTRDETQGRQRTERIFDSTAPQALVVATSAVHSASTPNTLKWFSLMARDEAVNRERAVQLWLTDTRDRVLRALNQSNFDSEIQEVYADLLAFGTAALDIREDDPDETGIFSGLIFQAHQPGTFTVAEGRMGTVDTVFRELRMSIASAASRWGLEALSPKAQEKFEDHPDEELCILWVTVPREGVKVAPPDTVLPPEERPFAEFVIELESFRGGTTGHLIRKTGAHELPVVAPRWRKMSGETYGRGPGIDVMPDVRTLNRAIKLRLEAWVLAVAPPVATRDRGVIGEVRLKPFGRTNVRERGDIEPLLLGSNFDVANFQEETIRRSIRSGFFIDQIQFTGSKGDTPISATEAAFRFQTMQRILGPVASRIQTELLAPIVSRVMRLMLRQGAILPPPLELSGSALDLVFEGPLARVQRSTDVEAINQFLAMLFPVAEVHPDVLARVDFGEVVQVLAEATGVPQRILRDEQETAAILQQQRQQQAEAVQSQRLLETAEVVSKFTKGGSGV